MTIGVLKRKWDAKFRFKVLVPVEEQGVYETPLDMDQITSRLRFSQFMKEAHPELRELEVVSFEPYVKPTEVAVEAPKVEVPVTPMKETVN